MGVTLSRHEKLTQAGLNLIPQAISIFDSNLRGVVINEPMRRMFNLPDHLAQPGIHFEDVIRFLTERGEYGEVDDIDAFIKARVQLARAFQPHYMERTRSNGRTITVEGTPLPEGGWVTVYTDITRLKQNDQMLRARSEELSEIVLARSEELAASNRELESTIAALEETKRQLTEIEARTRLTTEMMPAHIAHLDHDEVYTYSNRRLSSVLPGRPGNVVGMTFQDALGEGVYQRIKPRLDRAYRGEESVFEFTDTESARRIRLALTPDRDEDGDIRGIYILSMDITEETQARAGLQQARRREIAAQVTSGLAHDFSNLLTIILGMQSKLSALELPSKADPLVAGTLAAARRGGTLLNRIADMTGPRTLRLVGTDLRRFFHDLSILARPSLPEEVNLRIDVLVEPDPYLLDSGLLQDSLINLILNARDACNGKGEINITVATVRDTWIEIIVADTGPGFSDKALKKALHPFYTTKGGEGSGLGLAMVYDMTKTVGGDIRLGNTENGGRVVLRVPLRRAPPVPETGLVLLVEDNADLRGQVREMLIDSGFTVIETSNVEEAKGLIRDLPDISLVLSDIELEGEETGLDLLRDAPREHMPCFLMTSLPASDTLYQQALEIAPVLKKPFDREQLTAFLACPIHL